MKELQESHENVAVDEPNLQTLNEDCVFEVLNRLPTNYLYTIAETCTRLLDQAAIEYRRRHTEKCVCISMIDNKIVLLPNEHDVQMFGHKFLNLVVRGIGRNHRLDDRLLGFSTKLQHQLTNFAIRRDDVTKRATSSNETYANRIKCDMIEDVFTTKLSEFKAIYHV